MKTLLTSSLIALLLVSCARTPTTVEPISSKKEYVFRDKAGDYVLKRESGPTAKNRKLNAVKQELIGRSRNGAREVMERSIVMSLEGSIKGKLKILRPEKSEYSVWFDGQEYSTKSVLKADSKGFELNIKNPENKDVKEEFVKLPDASNVYCYFSQVIECAHTISFLNKAIENGSGQMNFYIVWEGYPFFQQQYIGLPEEFISPAQLTFDGINERKQIRFSLTIGNQVIFYHLDDDKNIQAIYWPAQGLSVGDNKSID